MNLDVRTKKTIEEGIQIREESEGSIFVLYSPGNGTIYTVVFRNLSNCSPELKDRMGLGTCGGWLVTYMNWLTMPSMIVLEDPQGLLHWEYVREKLRGVGAADAVVLAELIGHMVGRTCIPSEEFLE
jgi:hypothetical protein